MNPADCILYSGGAPGAEAEFGVNAERVRYLRHTGQLESVEIKGVHVYRREALELVRAQQRSKLAARAFVLFERGTKPADVVIKLEAEPRVATRRRRRASHRTQHIQLASGNVPSIGFIDRGASHVRAHFCVDTSRKSAEETSREIVRRAAQFSPSGSQTARPRSSTSIDARAFGEP